VGSIDAAVHNPFGRGKMMRFDRAAIGLLLVLLTALVAQPYMDRLLFAPTPPRPISPRAGLTDLEMSTIALFEQASPSVVQVVSVPPGVELSQGTTASQAVESGTGFVWDAAGHIVTNAHVVANAGSVAVRLSTGDVIDAEIVGRAPNYDLAVLRIAAGPRLPAALLIGSSSDLRVGQSTFAIGNPFGLDQTLTTGVISALNRQLPTTGGREISEVVQTDAAINPGNSGGPLLDSAARVVGVNTAIFSPSGANAGIGFAIPIDVVNRVVPELIRNGRVPTPGIGILSADESIATQLGVHGVVIGDVVPGSPAAQAGLRGIDLQTGTVGDIVVAANGTPVRRLSDLIGVLEQTGVGKLVTLTIQRGGGTISIEIPVVDIG
jgi:2-alkenal reductase